MKFIHIIVQKHPSSSNSTNSIKLFRMQDIFEREVHVALPILVLPPDHREVGFDNACIRKNRGQLATKILPLQKSAIAMNPSNVKFCLQIGVLINGIFEGHLVVIGVYYGLAIILNILDGVSISSNQFQLQNMPIDRNAQQKYLQYIQIVRQYFWIVLVTSIIFGIALGKNRCNAIDEPNK